MLALEFPGSKYIEITEKSFHNRSLIILVYRDMFITEIKGALLALFGF